MAVEPNRPSEGFLTDFERDLLLVSIFEAQRDTMQHFGLEVGGTCAYDLDFTSIMERRYKREYPDKECYRRDCNEPSTWHDYSIFFDGRGACEEHRVDRD